LIINKADPQAADLIARYNIEALTIEGATPGLPGQPVVLPYGKKTCLLDGAVRFPTDPFYADKWVLGCSRAEEDGAPKVLLDANTPVIDKGDVYDGCNARIHLNFYAYKGGSGGINAGLYGVLKTGDNERLGNADPDSGSAFAGVQGVGPSAVQVAQPAQPGGIQIPGQPVAPPPYAQQQPPNYQQPVQQYAPQPVAQPVQQFVQPGQPVQQFVQPQPVAVPQQPGVVQPAITRDDQPF